MSRAGVGSSAGEYLRSKDTPAPSWLRGFVRDIPGRRKGAAGGRLTRTQDKEIKEIKDFKGGVSALCDGRVGCRARGQEVARGWACGARTHPRLRGFVASCETFPAGGGERQAKGARGRRIRSLRGETFPLCTCAVLRAAARKGGEVALSPSRCLQKAVLLHLALQREPGHTQREQRQRRRLRHGITLRSRLLERITRQSDPLNDIQRLIRQRIARHPNIPVT